MKTWRKGDTEMFGVNFSLPREAVDILQRRSPSRRNLGNYVARLIFEDEARRQERERLERQAAAEAGA
jgi:hypothetical protein